MSMNIIQHFSPSLMHNFSKSIALLSLTALSTTLANSMASTSGGPDSKSGLDKGSNSTLTTMLPSSGLSGYGLSTPNLTPATITVSPIVIFAEPSADFADMPYSTFIGFLYSSNFLKSALTPLLSNDSMYDFNSDTILSKLLH